MASDAPNMIGQLEYRLFTEGKLLRSIFTNPFVVPILLGQLFFLISFLTIANKRTFSLTGFAILTFIVAFVLFDGVTNSNLFVIASTVPYIGIGTIYLKHEIRHLK
jgi:hypothetical protein